MKNLETRKTDGGLPMEAAIRRLTPARVFVPSSGPAYGTTAWLKLREDHAAARDAVKRPIDLEADFDDEFLTRWNLFEVSSRSKNQRHYLLDPESGRRLCEDARELLRRRCGYGADLQAFLGDGLSSLALKTQAPALLDALALLAKQNRWTFGQPFVVRHCRVGVMNDVGELLEPKIVVLLIGERPGLATAESLSAYIGYRPRNAHTDANRNLISNIHGRGVSVEDAARRIFRLAQKMAERETSGSSIKED